MSQVVDGFIKEATLMTVYQSYVEANILNDMMNLRDNIVESVARESLELVVHDVKGFLSYYSYIQSTTTEAT